MDRNWPIWYDNEDIFSRVFAFHKIRRQSHSNFFKENFPKTHCKAHLHDHLNALASLCKAFWFLDSNLHEFRQVEKKGILESLTALYLRITHWFTQSCFWSAKVLKRYLQSRVESLIIRTLKQQVLCGQEGYQYSYVSKIEGLYSFLRKFLWNTLS